MILLLLIVNAIRSIRASAVRQTPSLPSRRRSDALIGFCLSILLIGQTAFAASPGTTTGELLKIPVGTRAIGMGEAYTALADDSSALQWNPAGMSFAQQKEAGFMHSSLIENVNYEYLSAIAPGDSYSYGGSMSYLGYGSIAGYDNTPLAQGGGQPIGNQSAYAYDFSGGVSSLIKDAISLGVSASVLRETLADTSATTFDINAGGLYALPFHPLMGDYRLGFSALNLGPGLKFVSERDPLPRRYTFGAAAMHIKQWPLNLTADVGVPNDNSAYVAFGGEYWFKDVVALRLGYNGENNVGKGLRLGVGIKLRQLLFDYAYGGFGDFGATHRIGITLRWGEKIKQLNSEERKILKEARAAGQEGDYVQQILDMNELLEKNPDNDHILKEMIKTHEAMLKKELKEAVAESKEKETIPSPEEFALQDLVPGQQAVAKNPAGFNPQDPLGLDKLPDATTNLDVPSTETLLQAPPPSATSSQPTVTPGPVSSPSSAPDNTPAAPVVSQPTSSNAPAAADSTNEPLINPADIK